MQHSTLLSALAVSVLVWLHGIVRSSATIRACLRAGAARDLAVAVAVGVASFVVTWPSSPPFQAGHGLGTGFLIGALAAGLSMLGRRCAASAKSPGEALAALGAAIAPAVAACGLAVAVAYVSRVDALCGVALGWLSAVLVSAALGRDAGGSGDRTEGLADIFAGSLAATTVLAVYRGAGPAEADVWVSGTVVMGATVALTPAVASMFGGRPRAFGSRIVRACVGALLLGLAAYLISTHVLASLHATEPDARLLTAALIGLVVGALLLALESSGTTDERPWAVRAGLPAMLGLAASTAAHQTLGGAGIGFAALATVGLLLAGWPAAPMTENAQRRRIGPEPRVALTLMAGFLVGRAIGARLGPALRAFALPDHYAMLGVLIGMCLPMLAWAWMAHRRARQTTVASSLAALVCVPLVGVATVVLWGPKVVFAMTLGLSASALVAGYPNRAEAEDGPTWEPTALAAIALLGLFALLQWTGPALPLSELTRLERAKIVALLGIAPAVFVIAQVVARATQARRKA